MALFTSTARIRQILSSINISIDDIDELFELIKPASLVTVIHNQAVIANTNILADDLIPVVDAGKVCFYTTFCSFGVGGAFYANITNSGDSQIIQYNDGLDLFANNGYMFDIPLTNGDTVNFQYSENCTLNRLIIARTYG